MYNPIVASLSFGRFNKARPCNMEKLVAESGKPIRLVGYWGVGGKEHADSYDVETLSFLKQYREDVKRKYPPGINLKFIIADKHAEFNGFSSTAYASEMYSMINAYGFSSVYLSEIWEKHSLDFSAVTDGYPVKDWDSFPDSVLMENNAAKINMSMDPREAAQKYYLMRTLENKILEKDFKGRVFFTFSDERIRSILPDMPTLFLYARKGWSDAPWFINNI